MVSDIGSDEHRTSLVADAFRYQIRLILVCALAGLVLAFAFSYATPKSFTSTASVLINPLVGNPYSPDGAGDSLTNLETEAQLVRSDVLAGQVSQATSIPPRQLQANLTVTVPVNTQILQIAYSASTADDAATVVNDYAKSYLSIREQNRDAVVQDQISGLETQITNTQASLQKASAKAAQGDNYASRLAQTLTGQLASLRIQAAQITTSGKNAGQVISPGLKAGSPNGFPLPLLLAGGLLLGLVASVVAAVSRERSNHLVRHLQQVEGAGVPVLATVRGSRGEDRAAVYRRLRASLGRVPPGVLTVAACSHNGDGASGVVATELAVSTTRSGLRVLLLDTVGSASDLVAPTAAAGYGLSDLLVDDVDVEDALIAVSTAEERQLLLVTPGREPVAGAELFGTDAMVGVLNELKVHCDQMFVASAGLAEPDGPALTGQAESVLLVVTLGETSYSDVTSAMEWLRRSNTPLVGAVVVEKRKLKVAKDLGVGAAVQGGPDTGARPATDTDRVSTPVSRGATVARNA